jgi:hypothetical protein
LEDSRQRTGRLPPFHIYGFAIFPVLALYVPNADYTPFSELFAPLLAAIAGASVAWALLAIRLDRLKAGLVVSLGLVAFFGFNFVFQALWELLNLGPDLRRSRYPFALMALFFLVGSYLVNRARDVTTLTRIVNQISLIFVLTSSSFIAYDFAVRGSPDNHLDDLVSTDALTPPDELPDIYYILLDGYGRSDVLREIYGLDTSNFIERLESMGFYVAERSTTNYANTLQVLTAVFNLDYLALIAEAEMKASGGAPRNRKYGFKVLAEHLKHNRWSRTLRGLGYRIVNFASGWHPTEQLPSDETLSGPFNLTEFQIALLKMTPLPPILRELRLGTPLLLHRKRIHYTLDTLPTLADAGSPKFVFAHLMCPHFPYTFEEDGGFQPESAEGFSWNANQHPDGFDKEQYRQFTLSGYPPQVKYLNEQVAQMLRRLLARSAKPPIIILQGDHGPDALCHPTEPDLACLMEHFPILNAFYLPGDGRDLVYSEITPVNTFRVVLDAYFGARLEALPDWNFWSSYFEPFVYRDYTSEIQGSAGAELPAADSPRRRGAL